MIKDGDIHDSSFRLLLIIIFVRWWWKMQRVFLKFDDIKGEEAQETSISKLQLYITISSNYLAPSTSTKHDHIW